MNEESCHRSGAPEARDEAESIEYTAAAMMLTEISSHPLGEILAVKIKAPRTVTGALFRAPRTQTWKELVQEMHQN